MTGKYTGTIEPARLTVKIRLVGQAHGCEGVVELYGAELFCTDVLPLETRSVALQRAEEFANRWYERNAPFNFCEDCGEREPGHRSNCATPMVNAERDPISGISDLDLCDEE